jgi:hypothetical protein
MTDLRPLRLGELVDRSASFWRAHWKPLFRLALGFQWVQFLLVKASQVAARRVLPVMSGGLSELLKNDSADAVRQLTLGLSLLVAAALAALFVSQLGGVAASLYVYPRLLGRDGPDVGTSLKEALRRGGVTLGAFLLSMAWTALVGVGFLLPGAGLVGLGLALAGSASRAAVVLVSLGGVVVALGAVALFLWFLIRFLLTAQVVALENAGPLEVFRRTGALSSGRVGPGLQGVVKLRLMVLVTVIGGLLLVVGLVASLPTLLLGLMYGATFEPGRTVNELAPPGLLVPLELAESALGAVFAPLYVVFQVFFYVDMRVRREGLDLALKLAA